jgi:hypothetical protein
MKAELEELALFRVPGVAHVFPVSHLTRPEDLGEQRLAYRRARPAGEDVLRADARDSHHLRGPALFEDDRHPVERNEPAQLPDERLEGVVEVEGGAERAGAPGGGLEYVGAAA